MAVKSLELPPLGGSIALGYIQHFKPQQAQQWNEYYTRLNPRSDTLQGYLRYVGWLASADSIPLRYWLPYHTDSLVVLPNEDSVDSFGWCTDPARSRMLERNGSVGGGCRGDSRLLRREKNPRVCRPFSGRVRGAGECGHHFCSGPCLRLAQLFSERVHAFCNHRQ
jgi:hypothetical protein